MKTGVTTLKGSLLTGEALRCLEASGDGCLAVTGEDGWVVGLFSRRELLGNLLNGNRLGEAAVTAEALAALAARPLSECVSKSFLSVGPLEPVLSIARSVITAAPPPEAIFVVDDRGLLLGVIERGDIWKRCLEYLGR